MDIWILNVSTVSRFFKKKQVDCTCPQDISGSSFRDDSFTAVFFSA